jgi:hypothetical protein
MDISAATSTGVSPAVVFSIRTMSVMEQERQRPSHSQSQTSSSALDVLSGAMSPEISDRIPCKEEVGWRKIVRNFTPS